MSFLSGVLENLKSDELKTLEQYAQESGYIPRRSQDIENIRGFKQIAHQIDAYYARGRYPTENAITLFEYHSSKNRSKIACLHITYLNGNIPVLIDLAPQFIEGNTEQLFKDVQEETFVILRREGEKNPLVVSEVVIDGEEHIFTFTEL